MQLYAENAILMPPNEAPVVGKQKQLSDKYLMILRRQADGSWKISTLIWNGTPPSKE